jgi:hypothetical protein
MTSVDDGCSLELEATGATYGRLGGATARGARGARGGLMLGAFRGCGRFLTGWLFLAALTPMGGPSSSSKNRSYFAYFELN